MRRRAGESLLLGNEIEIEILEVGPTRVKLGIVAPPHLAIVRKEVLLTRAENLTASQNQDPRVIAWLSRKLAPRHTGTVNSLTPLTNPPKNFLDSF
ncbi:MAG TPA: carbon storage regulator [Bryobacteraceae bacterium]|nr:carbon storage regulator [Bryobacteraceae bacterium]